MVTSERAEGQVKYIAIQSLKGQPCHVVNPWGPQEKVRVKLADSEETLIEAENAAELTFETEPGNVYIVERTAQPISSFDRETISGVRNEQAKLHGQARLGIPRQF